MSENMQTCPSCGDIVPIEYVLCVWCGFDLTAEHIRRSGIVIGRKEAFQRMGNILRKPLQTSKEIALIPDKQGGKLNLYFLAIFMTLNMLTVFSKLNGTSFNTETSDPIPITTRFSITIPFSLTIGIIFLVVQPLLLYIVFRGIWIVATRILIVFSRSIGGFGNKDKINSAIGYSMVPVSIGWALSWIFTLLAKKVDVNAGDYDSISSGINDVTTKGIGGFGSFFILIGWIWTVVLIVITMRQAAKLSWIESSIAAGIPASLMMIVVIFGTDFIA